MGTQKGFAKISKKKIRRLEKCKDRFQNDSKFHELVNSTVCLFAGADKEDADEIYFFADWILNHPNYRPDL